MKYYVDFSGYLALEAESEEEAEEKFYNMVDAAWHSVDPYVEIDKVEGAF